ncbi:zinc finger-like domain-containing protein [Phyllobacterium chamaecytisi]|uniref:zinc finger-like domain-containing protein n=1 Tax=Phyllobacterium chamaecytisi TaxID=2876082 RepID=UPI001CCD21EE|nr:zinc finger-like domain-containing protein [Phyllobacterium sp. KW56]MBZ9600684.1 hypothetical protein [Phyllobacterium sp. KW56]
MDKAKTIRQMSVMSEMHAGTYVGDLFAEAVALLSTLKPEGEQISGELVERRWVFKDGKRSYNKVQPVQEYPTPCADCDGQGERLEGGTVEYPNQIICDACNGSGKVLKPYQMRADEWQTDTCDECKSTKTLQIAEIERLQSECAVLQAEIDTWKSIYNHITALNSRPSTEQISRAVAYACEADIRALTEDGADISLSTIPLPQYGMKMPLYIHSSPSEQISGEAVERAALQQIRVALTAHWMKAVQAVKSQDDEIGRAAMLSASEIRNDIIPLIADALEPKP